MSAEKPKRKPGRPRVTGMKTRSMRWPTDTLKRLEERAAELTAEQPQDRRPVKWTDVVRELVREHLPAKSG